MKFGIDLGTTNSLITYWVKLLDDNFDLKTLTNEFGSKLTESVVYFEEDNDDVVVGKIASTNYAEYPDRTVRWVKRFMGKTKKFNIDNNEFTPQEISALILSKLKGLAENQGELKQGELKEVVITVPADFDQNAKRATEDAAKIAGFEKVFLVSEPNAAILSYIYSRKQIGKLDQVCPNKENYYLVFDLGGGTFDVSLSKVEVDDTKKVSVIVLSSAGNKYLGGLNFDLDLMKYVLEKVMKTDEEQHESMEELLFNYEKYYKKDEAISDNIRLVLSRLIEQCEQVKIALSQTNVKKLHFFNQHGQAIKVIISKSELELIIKPHISQMKKLINDVLLDTISKTNGSFKSWNDLDVALLVGGSSNIPIIMEFCEETFCGKTKSGVDTFEAISQGAAIYAGIKSNELDSFGTYKQIIPHDFGIKLNNELITILEKGSNLNKNNYEYTIPFALDTKSPIVIAQKYYSEDGNEIYPEIEKINYYHPFILTGDKLDIEFSLDDNMILSIIVKELRIDDEVETIVDSAIGLNKDEINKSKKKIKISG